MKRGLWMQPNNRIEGTAYGRRCLPPAVPHASRWG